MSDLPSVTQIIKVAGLTNYRSGHERAMAVGRATHKAILLSAQGRLDEASLHPEIAMPFGAFKKLKDAMGLVLAPSHMEHEFEHPTWAFQGHPDCFCLMGDEPGLVLWDWKVSDSPDLFAATIQLAGYKMLCEAHGFPIRACYVGRLGKDGSYSPHNVTSPEAEQVFQAAVILYRARERGNRL